MPVRRSHRRPSPRLRRASPRAGLCRHGPAAARSARTRTATRQEVPLVTLPASNPSKRPNEKTAMDEWVSLFASRDELAEEYANLLRDREPTWSGWPVLNLAIMDRWSESGLRYVKSK